MNSNLISRTDAAIWPHHWGGGVSREGSEANQTTGMIRQWIRKQQVVHIGLKLNCISRTEALFPTFKIKLKILSSSRVLHILNSVEAWVLLQKDKVCLALLFCLHEEIHSRESASNFPFCGSDARLHYERSFPLSGNKRFSRKLTRCTVQPGEISTNWPLTRAADCTLEAILYEKSKR